ncbi:MAG: hypothetical protein M3R39_08415 [Actinomycetota bacterium]|nr:hypothetical protein [Actinomycetota bacterium]
MTRRAIPVGLVVAAAAADGAEAHGLAFYALLAAVPAAAVLALSSFGDLLDGTVDHVHALLWAVVLLLTVTGAAVRAPALAEGAVPALARTALLISLAVFCLQAVLGVAFELRRRGDRPQLS